MGYDFKSVQTGKTEFTSIPAGRYNLRIETAVPAKTAKNEDMIKLKFVVTDGPHKGRMCFEQLTFGSTSLWKTKMMLELTGSALADSSNAGLEEIAAELTGKMFSAYLEEGLTSTGKATNNVKNYAKIETGAVEQKTLFS